jgi:hypothetical protein
MVRRASRFSGRTVRTDSDGVRASGARCWRWRRLFVGKGVVNVKDATPVSKGTICGDHNRSEFVSGRDDLKQQVSTAFVNGQAARFVEQQQ